MLISTRNTMQEIAAAKEERAYFAENGFSGPFCVYEPAFAELLWKTVRLELLKKENAIYPNSRMNYDRHLDIKALSDIVSHPDIVRRVANILGPNVLCWRTEWFPKYPGDQATAWHQARSYVAFEGDPKLVPTDPNCDFYEVTVWFAFTDATRDMGCLKIIPKTHRTWYFDEMRNAPFDPSHTMKGKGAGFYGYDFEKLKIDPNWKPDETAARHFEMRAGQILVFTESCLHGSEPNITKDKVRMGFSMRYTATHVKVYANQLGSFTQFGEEFSLERYAAMLVGGTDSFGHNKTIGPLE